MPVFAGSVSPCPSRHAPDAPGLPPRPAGDVAPLDDSAIIRATLLGRLVWNEIPDMLTFVGAGTLIAGGVFIIWREHRSEL